MLMCIKLKKYSTLFPFKPTCRNVCGFFATDKPTLAQRVSEQTNSSIRIYAGNNVNHVTRCPCTQRVTISAYQ